MRDLPDFGLFINCNHRNVTGGEPKIPGIVKKIIYSICTSLKLHSPSKYAHGTGCSNASTASNAGNIVQNLQRKCCQGPPAGTFGSPHVFYSILSRFKYFGNKLLACAG